jgi:hypothetical protein
MADERKADLDVTTAPGEGADDMHIHRPRAPHGWRELIGEVGIIVIGIVIALGGEQALEALHWARQADAGETALKGEFAREAYNAALREAQSACITRRLADLSATVQRASESGRLPPVPALGHPPFTPWTIGVWDALVADQTVSHLPRDKTIAYTKIERMTAYLSGLSDQEEDQWATLDSMVGPGRRLSDAEAEQLRTVLAKAASSNEHMRSTSEHLAEAVKATGLVGPAAIAAAAREAAWAMTNTPVCR